MKEMQYWFYLLYIIAIKTLKTEFMAINFPVHPKDHFRLTGRLNFGCLTRYTVYFVFCRVDESALTGESEDVVKTAGKAPFLRSGSNVLEGQGRLLVTAVGTNSQQGQIFGALNAPSDGMRSQFPPLQSLCAPNDYNSSSGLLPSQMLGKIFNVQSALETYNLIPLKEWGKRKIGRMTPDLAH